jgi:DNA replication protein DnaC
LPSTAELTEARERALAVRAELGAGPPVEGSRYKQAQRDLELAEERLRWGLERDALATGRPEGCWCLGQGGKTLRYFQSGLQAFETYCGCPEGFAAESKAREEHARWRAERRQSDIRRLFAEARLPARFERCSFQTFPVSPETAEAYERVRFWASGPADADERAEDDPDMQRWFRQRQSLFIYGPFGVGKTGLAVAALRRRMGEGLEAGLFITVPGLLDRIRRTYSDDRGGGSEHEVLEMVKTVPLLLLDDLGAERVTDWVAERLFVVINHRHDDDLPTIFTSNLNPEQLAAHIGERTTWRVIEMSELVHLDGPNQRDRIP